MWCKVEWCQWQWHMHKNGKRYLQKWYCVKHYARIQRWCNVSSSRRDYRDAIIEWDIAKIPIWVWAKDWYAIVDKEFAWLDKYKWYILRDRYACCTVGVKNIFMHHIILDRVYDMCTDHIDWNWLNNRKSNLRIISKQGNNMNRVVCNRNSKTLIRWVCLDSESNKYRVYIWIDGKQISWWRYNNIDEAIKRRKELEKIYFSSIIW